jgi:hypothetical protein
MMESDPHWAYPHSKVFQGYTDIMQIAGSPAVDKERQALLQKIEDMIVKGDPSLDVARERDRQYEFLVHEKFDADTEGKAFGRTYPNALIASKYSEVVARSLGFGDPAFKGLTAGLAAAAEALFDKLDQEAKSATPPPATQPSAPPPPAAP